MLKDDILNVLLTINSAVICMLLFPLSAVVCLCSLIYFCFSHHKQLNGNLKGITFVVLAVHEQVVLMNSSYNELRLLLYVHDQFAMSLDLLPSTILHLWLLLCANNSAVES